MVIKPVGKRVIIEKILDREEKTTVSGIILPISINSESVFQGKVIAIGSLKEKGEIAEIEIGDIIIYGENGEIKIPGERNLYIVSLEHIYALKRG